ncbi:MAG: semialdehyde dehydrogenase, partial [Oricola sp.]|nr:semialdehyde dehydrogenase [Oricola sp.]
DEAVRRGVPRDAAFDFLLGHLNIELAIMFGITPGRLSDGAMQAINDAKPVLFKEGWLENVFDPAAIRQSIMAICEPPKSS